MATIANLSIKITLDSQRLNVDLGKVRKELSGLGKPNALGSLGDKAMGWLKGLPAQLLAAAGAYISLSTAIQQLSASMERIDRRAKISSRLGIEFGTLQRIDILAKRTNTDLELVTKGLLHMQRSRSGDNRPLDKQLFSVAKELNAIHDPARRSARAIEVFGKGGFELLDFIAQAEHLERSTKLIDRFGLSMSRLDAAKVEAANDSLMDMKIVAEGFLDRLTTRFAPSIESIATKILSMADRLDNSFRALNTSLEDVIVGSFGVLGSLDKIDRLAERSPFLKGAFRAIGLDIAPEVTAPDVPPGGSPADGSLSREPIRPRAFERNTSDAVSAILKAGGDPISGLDKKMAEAVRLLRRIADDGDPLRKDAAGRDVRLVLGGI